MHSMRIAILGGGPAGLMAAWAAVERGYRPTIFDAEGKEATARLLKGDVNAGVFLLHDPCGLVSVPSAPVRYAVAGHGYSLAELAEMYAEKVYGDRRMAEEVSVAHYASVHEREEWDGLEAVRHLAHRFEDHYAKPLRINSVRGVEDIGGTYPRTVCTVPLPRLFAHHPLNPDNWPSAEVQLYVGGAHPRESWVHYLPVPGVDEYRQSAVFGRFVSEYPASVERDPKLHVRVLKPIRPPAGVADLVHDVEAGGRVLFAGRFGRWQKGVEQHDVYRAVSEWLDD